MKVLTEVSLKYVEPIVDILVPTTIS